MYAQQNATVSSASSFSSFSRRVTWVSSKQKPRDFKQPNKFSMV